MPLTGRERPVRGTFACKQRELGCPAEKPFGGKRGTFGRRGERQELGVPVGVGGCGEQRRQRISAKERRGGVRDFARKCAASAWGPKRVRAWRSMAIHFGRAAQCQAYSAGFWADRNHLSERRGLLTRGHSWTKCPTSSMPHHLPTWMDRQETERRNTDVYSKPSHGVP